MKPLGHYSPEKFKSLIPAARLKALDKLITALEMVISDESERNRLIMHIIELAPLLDTPLPERLHLFLKELNPRLSPHQLLNKLYFYHQGALRIDSQLPLRQVDPGMEISPMLRQRARQVTIICDNLRSVFNVGSLFRIAECLGLGELLLCGISPSPEHPNMPKTAMGTEKIVAWRHFNTTASAITACREQGYRIVALETSATASSVFSTALSVPLALVIGNESLGIAPEVLEQCDEAVFLPQLGWKSSLNVGVASAVALYQIIMGGANG